MAACEGRTDSPEEPAAAERSHRFEGTWFLEPILRGSYPEAFVGKGTSRCARDTRRIEYYRLYLAALARVMAGGADVRGYHAWTLMDNVERTEEKIRRFGLMYFTTQERIIEESGCWYARLAETGLLVS